MRNLVLLALLGVAMSPDAGAAGLEQTVVYDGKATKLANTEVTGQALWITEKDLRAATGFYVKPKGICRDELCFPIPAKRKADFLSKRGGVSWFNLTEFASLIKQPVARDEKNRVWYFGPRAQSHEAYLETLEAPNFTLPDVNGKQRSLSDFRGRKVMLVTWASW
jgi:hypothetical protein